MSSLETSMEQGLGFGGNMDHSPLKGGYVRFHISLGEDTGRVKATVSDNRGYQIASVDYEL